MTLHHKRSWCKITDDGISKIWKSSGKITKKKNLTSNTLLNILPESSGKIWKSSGEESSGKITKKKNQLLEVITNKAESKQMV